MCASTLLRFILPALALLLLDGPCPLRAEIAVSHPGCPTTRFIRSLNGCHYGRLGNNIFSFKGLLELGEMTGRTAVVPPTAPGYSHLESVLDLEAMKKEFCFILERDLPVPVGTETKVPEPVGNVCPQCPSSVAVPMILNSTQHKGSNMVHYPCQDIYQVASFVRKTEPPYEKVGNRNPEDFRPFDVRFFRLAALHPEIELTAKVYRHAHLDPMYVSYHLRHFENTRALADIGTLDPEGVSRLYKIATGTDLSAAMAKARETSRSAMCITSDRQNADRERRFLNYGAVMMPTPNVHPNAKLTYGMGSDFCLLTASHVFIGQEYSSIDRFVAGRRFALGIPTNRTILVLPPNFK